VDREATPSLLISFSACQFMMMVPFLSLSLTEMLPDRTLIETMISIIVDRFGFLLMSPDHF
jgi:hypothetical protein